MSAPASKPYWIDDNQWGRHETYGYGDHNSRVLSLDHAGRCIHVLFPESVPPVAVRSATLSESGDLLHLLGEELDDQDSEGGIIEGGDAVVMIARRHPTREGTYWLLVWHNVYPEIMGHAGY